MSAWMLVCAATFCLKPPYVVRDGDTLIGSGVAVRLWGVDAPEKREPGGAEATEALRRLIEGQPLAVLRHDRPAGRQRVGRVQRRGVQGV